MSKILRLPLKTKFFEMTARGEKKEDYREITPYWFIRLVYDYRKVFKYLSGRDWDVLDEQLKQDYLQLITSDKMKSNMIGYKPFDVNIMTLGYPKSTDVGRIIKFVHGGVEIREGKEEWGAEAARLYFVIKHGEQLGANFKERSEQS